MEPTQLPRYDATPEQCELLGEAIKRVARNLTTIRSDAVAGDDTANRILDRLDDFNQGLYQSRRITEFIHLVAAWEPRS
jgi:hypothetical protein